MTHDVEILAHVKITEHQRSDAITRITGPGGDEWREHLYADIKTEQDVLNHWATNAVYNGYTDICQLDGWADLPAETVTMQVIRAAPA